jgi:hypothetical protein
MNTRLLAGALLALGAPIIASAQCVGVTPATALVGTKYAFTLAIPGSAPGTSPRFGAINAIGTFQAFPGGYLALTETVVDLSGSNSQVISRMAPASGRWMSNPTCTGGMLQFMLNREFYDMTYTVSTVGGQQRLTIDALLSQDRNHQFALAPVQAYVVTGCVGPGVPAVSVGAPAAPPPSCNAITGPSAWAPPPLIGRITGTAFANPPSACPLGQGNPLTILKDKILSGTISTGDTFTAVASFLNPNAYSGDLTIVRKLSFNDATGRPVLAMNQTVPTTPINPNLPINWFTTYPAELSYGRYIIYPDCSGGELLLMGGLGTYRQLEFVFTNSTFTTIATVVDGSPTL